MRARRRQEKNVKTTSQLQNIKKYLFRNNYFPSQQFAWGAKCCKSEKKGTIGYNVNEKKTSHKFFSVGHHVYIYFFILDRTVQKKNSISNKFSFIICIICRLVKLLRYSQVVLVWFPSKNLLFMVLVNKI